MKASGAKGDWPLGYGRRVLAEVDSTNAEAMRIANQLTGPEWILGLCQTAARGRRGRAWVSSEGNFSASLVMPLECGPAEAALRSFVAAVALCETLNDIAGPAGRFALKWPNDVLLNNGKIAGILLESAGVGTHSSYLVIGIGVNLSAAPEPRDVEPRALRPVSLLSETGIVIAAEAFLDRLAPVFAQFEAQFRTFGFAPIRSAWLAQAARLGETITARTGTAEVTGRFETVDEQGHLVLLTPDARQAIPAADVFF